jgi:CBS domain-containing protein
MNVESILRTKGTKVVTILPDVPIGEVVKILKQAAIGAAVVSEDGKKVLGIISERDIVNNLAEPNRRDTLLETSVSDLMTRNVLTCSVDDSVQTCMSMMTERRCRHLPVIRDGEMVGIVSIGDLVKNRLGELEKEAGFLREMIAG